MLFVRLSKKINSLNLIVCGTSQTTLQNFQELSGYYGYCLEIRTVLNI